MQPKKKNNKMHIRAAGIKKEDKKKEIIIIKKL